MNRWLKYFYIVATILIILFTLYLFNRKTIICEYFETKEIKYDVVSVGKKYKKREIDWFTVENKRMGNILHGGVITSLEDDTVEYKDLLPEAERITKTKIDPKAYSVSQDTSCPLDVIEYWWIAPFAILLLGGLLLFFKNIIRIDISRR